MSFTLEVDKNKNDKQVAIWCAIKNATEQTYWRESIIARLWISEQLKKSRTALANVGRLTESCLDGIFCLICFVIISILNSEGGKCRIFSCWCSHISFGIEKW